jgi:glyoxylase-like metal-dependent hydrolase (beta-lactamase superfamily II)
VAAVHADLDLLEAETGLTRIELVVITHYHGDHCQFSDLIRERYGAQICATPDVAILMEEPKRFRYPCTVDWYNFPFDSVKVDRRLAYEETFMWNDIPVTPIHTPGHCFAHTGFLVPWNGQLTACTGDTLQYSAGAVAQWLPFSYNDTAWPAIGNAVTYQRVLDAGATLILGGHSSFFFDPEGAIIRDMLAVVAEAEALARQMVPNGDLTTCMTPPGFDALRPATVMSEA